MSKPEWGIKRSCQNCNARFYDMRRDPIICPKCEQTFDPEASVKKRRGRPPLSESKVPPLPTDLEEDLVLELEEGLPALDESDDLLEDTSDFGEDESVVAIEPSVRDD